ncbi:hypothetical protein BAE44_0006065 [Dichanthelium oligosanthes]|uniref:Uncharacterized protein n=1 Tax=Dichanthelium oligosanthes TaxID=888268 RepID=A0A1E5W653_9POAL|nr:hypothetical protein BAE44_0006065 [Dichanthelium oligosanthes]
MAGQSPLRRWKPFFAAFGLVDAAIEAAAGPALSRDAFRSARGDVVEMLCDVPTGGDDLAEELCVVLDGFMSESLVTLRSVPDDAVPRVLASSAELANAVGALRCHESERVRGLARDIVSGWRASVETEIVRVSAAIEKLDDLVLPSETTRFQVCDGHSCNTSSDHDANRKMKSEAKIQESWQPCPNKTAVLVKSSQASDPLSKKTTPVAGSHGTRTENTRASTIKISQSLTHKKQPPVIGRATGDGLVMPCSPEEKMEATKRKLHKGYQEAADAKRQRKIRVIEAPKMLEQRQRKIHPILRERSRARCGNPTAVRRCLFPSVAI